MKRLAMAIGSTTLLATLVFTSIADAEIKPLNLNLGKQVQNHITRFPSMNFVPHSNYVHDCIVQFEFGNFGTAAYAKARILRSAPGYTCKVDSQVVILRNGRKAHGPLSPRSSSTTTWIAQSTLANSRVWGAEFAIYESNAKYGKTSESFQVNI